MLGRDLVQVRREGLTGFAGDHDATAAEPFLRADGLTKRHLLHDVTFTVRPGEVTGLGGLLGSGRSETAKAIIGALPLDSGTVAVGGRRLRHLSPAHAIRAGMALLPEDRKAEGIIPDLSVRENIVLAAMPRLARAGVVSRARQDRIVETFMKRLRIKASSPEQPVAELSGGNQQKVLLARWLCLEPRLLLLDEPTRGIDVGAKAEVQKLVDELARDGLAVVLISSDLEELVEGADRVVVLRAGAVVGELDGAEVTEHALMAALVADDPSPDDGPPTDSAAERAPDASATVPGAADESAPVDSAVIDSAAGDSATAAAAADDRAGTAAGTADDPAAHDPTADDNPADDRAAEDTATEDRAGGDGTAAQAADRRAGR
jgi:monosaccharide-transporting ATPase